MPVLNPWIILIALVGVLVFGAGCYTKGHSNGAMEQKAADQVELDKVNAQIRANKAEADRILRESKDENIRIQLERDKFKIKLGQEAIANAEKTDALSRIYAAYGLRFRADEARRSGQCGKDGLPSCSDTASPDGGAIIQLPDALAGNLRLLVKDADRLKDNYKTCRDYAIGVK